MYVCVQQDVKGLEAVKQYWKKYFDTYQFKHEVIAGAVDKDDKVAFSFWANVVSGNISFVSRHDDTVALAQCKCVAAEQCDTYIYSAQQPVLALSIACLFAIFCVTLKRVLSLICVLDFMLTTLSTVCTAPLLNASSV